jgi:hypothetical protein
VTINEILTRGNLTPQEKVAFEVAARAGSLVPTNIWASWPSHSMRDWQDAVFANVLKVLKENNMREAS